MSAHQYPAREGDKPCVIIDGDQRVQLANRGWRKGLDCIDESPYTAPVDSEVIVRGIYAAGGRRQARARVTRSMRIRVTPARFRTEFVLLENGS